MNRVFADTSYWFALAAPRDALHQRASALSAAMAPLQIVTSEWILTEFLNSFAEARTELRIVACRVVQSLIAGRDVLIVPQTSDGFATAFELFSDRPDKGWSLTDCSFFLIMRELEIRQALTSDKHFEQAGFEALLR